MGYAISSVACYPADTPLTIPVFSGMWGALLAMNITALAVGVLGFLIAHRNWSATRLEQEGDSQQLIERGEGRTRFLAMCGLLVAAGFVTATAFTSVTLVFSPICR